ncbi:hypothetical protein LS684_06390 [Cytobacillus spongiae]|uniref:hypothetical protein n=1 Tax=Cytobacillus spongiae TaxID=2901381 RepID=UPI001F225EA0|nr:hypothetical protein [Cytobacillus spongiae]UII57064.1 hypothetical protein LS684_06390 [Cytobacillus spongiae]
MNNVEFMKFWFSECEGLVEFRLIGKEGVRGQHFVEVSAINDELLQPFINSGKDKTLNVYFGVATRTEKDKGKEQDVLDVPGLWVDIDPKHASMEEAIHKVSNLPTPPSAIISSGNGIHAYFKLNKPFRISTSEDFQKIKGMSSGIHKLLNADNTSDLARLLRVPGSLNVKNPENKQACSVVELTGAVYSIEEFKYLNEVEFVPKTTKVEKVVIRDYMPLELEELRVHKHILRLIEEGAEKGNRSEKVFGVTWSMLENGHTPEEIAYVLTNPDWAISEKVLERPIQHQLPYIENAINNALQRIEEGRKFIAVTENMLSSEIVEKQGCYYHGEKRLSNFIFTPSERVLLGTNEILKGIIEVNDGTQITVLLDHTSLISKKDLLTSINSSRVSWLGGDKEIQYLREHLLTKKVVDRKGVTKIGLHKGNFVTSHEVINHTGMVQDSSLVYVSKFPGSVNNLEKSVTLRFKDSWREGAKKVVALLPTINEATAIYPIIGWHMVSSIAPLVREQTDNGFPQLMIWGTKGSGKTSTAQLFGKLFGNGEVRSCCRPPFSIMKEMDILNAVPLYLDEYRPQQMNRDYMNQVKHMALAAYKGLTDARGQQNQSVVEYQYTAPVVWMGETPFTEPNLLERIAMAKLSPNTFIKHPDYKANFRQLNRLDVTSFLGGYVKWILSKVHFQEFNLHQTVMDMKEQVEDSYNVPERVSFNIATILTGLCIFQELAGDLGVEAEPIPFEDIISNQIHHLVGEEARSSLDRYMEHTATLIDRGEYLTPGTDYLYDSQTGQLILATSDWKAAVQKFWKDHGYFEESMGDAQLRNFLKENEQVGGYVVAAQNVRRTFGKKQKRCTIINVFRLEHQLGIPADTWIY